MAFFDKVADPGEVLELADGRILLSRATNGDKVAVVRIGKDYYALKDRCPHLGCSLAKGALEGTTLVCHCHSSRFDLRTGERLAGPAKRGVATYAVELSGGAVTIVPRAKREVA